jgi:pimeloyl-ACP methyl ester carboxylesterase
MSEKAVRINDGQDGVVQPAAHSNEYVEANGLKLHYLDYGTRGRPPMLCVHGGAAHAHWFDFVAPGFSADYHVRSLDLRGHGDSAWVDPPAYSYTDYAADVAAIAEKLDLRDFVLVGHSMGGMVSLVYAATHPGRVGKLVVVDTTMHMNTDSIARLREMGMRPTNRYATQEDLITRYRLLPAGTDGAAPEIIRHVAQHSGRQVADGDWRHKFDRGLYAIFERRDGIPLWDSVKIPSLLVKGERSNRISAEVLEEIRTHAPQVRLAEVPASDHHITLDNPRGFVQVVREFLTEV